LQWARDEQFDASAVARRIRFVGITWRKHTSPNTWRWQQDAPWLAAFPRSAVKNVSIPGRLWDYLGNRQQKVTRTQPPHLWTEETWRTAPPREEEHFASLRLALRIFDTARTRPEQFAFAAELSDRLHRQQWSTSAWVRTLIAEVRKTNARATP
jgi:hypothetical protein